MNLGTLDLCEKPRPSQHDGGLHSLKLLYVYRSQSADQRNAQEKRLGWGALLWTLNNRKIGRRTQQRQGMRISVRTGIVSSVHG